MSPSIENTSLHKLAKYQQPASPVKLNYDTSLTDEDHCGPTLIGANAHAKTLSLNPFQRLLEQLHIVLGQPIEQPVDADEVYRILEEYKSDPADWAHYAFYDPLHYKRNLIDEGQNYNVMILGWGPGVMSCIHDHPGAHCFMKVLEGELVESRYHWPSSSQGQPDESSSEMKLIAETRSHKNDVIYINGLHRVWNSDKIHNCTSLHVYVPPFKSCRVFDQKTGQPRECKMTFYSKRGIVLTPTNANQQQDC